MAFTLTLIVDLVCVLVCVKERKSAYVCEIVQEITYCSLSWKNTEICFLFNKKIFSKIFWSTEMQFPNDNFW